MQLTEFITLYQQATDQSSLLTDEQKQVIKALIGQSKTIDEIMQIAIVYGLY